jgi:hypothetical protein
MSILALRDPLRHFLQEVGFDSIIRPADLEAGLEHIEVELQRIALDARVANTQGTRLVEAVSDFENYPHLARCHTAIDDILTMSLPPELEAWARNLVSAPEPPSFEGVRCALLSAAADSSNATRQALARLALFEGVRLNLVLMARWNPSETFGVGMELKNLDEIAEDIVDRWLSEGPAIPANTRPFHILVAAALERLAERSAEMRTFLWSMQKDFVEAQAIRGHIEATLAQMDAVDALLIRNHLAPAFDEQKLTVEHLQKRHVMALGGMSRDALDQRVHRARQKGAASLRRRRVALIDLLRGGQEATPARTRGRR